MSQKSNFAVIGLGEFGFRICAVLVEGGASVVGIDRDANAVERIKTIVSAAMVVDTTNEDSLLKAPLEDIDVAIVAIGDDIEGSILTTTLLKQRGIPYVISRAVSSLHSTVLRRVGANEVLNIEVASATRLARRLVAPDISSVITITNDVTLREMILPQFFVGKTMQEIAMDKKFNITLIALVRLEFDIDKAGNSIQKEVLYYPDDVFEFKSADKIFVMGRTNELDEFRKM